MTDHERMQKINKIWDDYKKLCEENKEKQVTQCMVKD